MGVHVRPGKARPSRKLGRGTGARATTASGEEGRARGGRRRSSTEDGGRRWAHGGRRQEQAMGAVCGRREKGRVRGGRRPEQGELGEGKPKGVDGETWAREGRPRSAEDAGVWTVGRTGAGPTCQFVLDNSMAHGSRGCAADAAEFYGARTSRCATKYLARFSYI